MLLKWCNHGFSMEVYFGIIPLSIVIFLECPRVRNFHLICWSERWKVGKVWGAAPVRGVWVMTLKVREMVIGEKSFCPVRLTRSRGHDSEVVTSLSCRPLISAQSWSSTNFAKFVNRRWYQGFCGDFIALIHATTFAAHLSATFECAITMGFSKVFDRGMPLWL